MTTNNHLYIHRDMIVDETYYLSMMSLLKLVYRLDIIDQNTAIAIAVEFRPFFV